MDLARDHLSPSGFPFLTAQWRDLVVLNYEIDPKVISHLVPAGTEIDLWQGCAYVSVVAFMFLDTKLLGIPVPFHRNFEEINLRFYVRHKASDGWRRGVCFVKELVPRWAIATVARLVYNENYISVPMGHQFRKDSQSESGGRDLEYTWQEFGLGHSVSARISGLASPVEVDSFEEFILEHYWGYTRQRDGTTIEYRVEHPRWQIWKPVWAKVDCDVGSVYGAEFAKVVSGDPYSAVVADGSNIAVHRAKSIGR